MGDFPSILWSVDLLSSSFFCNEMLLCYIYIILSRVKLISLAYVRSYTTYRASFVFAFSAYFLDNNVITHEIIASIFYPLE